MSQKDETPIPTLIKGRSKEGVRLEYERGKFLGKGGFAKVYELIPLNGDKTIYAGKIMSRKLMAKEQQKEKLKLEISLHKSLDFHKNIVKFVNVFEDEHFVYIVLEHCKSKSMMELHKRRKAVSEPEARFFVRQILEGLVHLHDRRIVHRDLKLGNLFLDENLIVKIGDFGLATEVKPNERKQTICGTPNYIAPEVLLKKGHAFEVDVWAVGCILFTLLVGKPPFETQTLKETYSRIKSNQYTIPTGMNAHAARLIRRLLSPNAESRPMAKDVLNDSFFTSGLLPKHLPTSCLTMTPRFDRRSTIHPCQQPTNTNRPALMELRGQLTAGSGVREGGKKPSTVVYSEGVDYRNQVQFLLMALRNIEHNYKFKHAAPSTISMELTSPEMAPFYWVSKWVDYSDKYGLSYQLCDGSSGVLFNDSSRIVLYADGDTVQYIDNTNVENFYTIDVYPQQCVKKITLLKYFKTYMNENLVQTGQQMKVPEADVFSRLPFLHKWFRHQTAIVFLLSNGSVQMNFFECHSKLIFCPVMQAVTLIDPEKTFYTFKLQDLNDGAYPSKLHKLMRTAEKAMGQLMTAVTTPSAAAAAS